MCPVDFCGYQRRRGLLHWYSSSAKARDLHYRKAKPLPLLPAVNPGLARPLGNGKENGRDSTRLRVPGEVGRPIGGNRGCGATLWGESCCDSQTRRSQDAKTSNTDRGLERRGWWRRRRWMGWNAMGIGMGRTGMGDGGWDHGLAACPPASSSFCVNRSEGCDRRELKKRRIPFPRTDERTGFTAHGRRRRGCAKT